MSATPDHSTNFVYSPGSVASVPQSFPVPKRWTRTEYHRLAELGWFRDERVELIEGEIFVMSPQSPEHYLALDRIRRCLEKAFGEGFWVRAQGPLGRGEHNEPEPDVSVVKGKPEDYAEHPTSGLLVVEVSLSSLYFDLTYKQSLYASMNVPEYWVLDLENRQLLVHRGPIEDSQQPLGHRYSQIETIAADGHVAPLENPEAKLAVAEMLPPKKAEKS